VKTNVLHVPISRSSIVGCGSRVVNESTVLHVTDDPAPQRIGMAHMPAVGDGRVDARGFLAFPSMALCSEEVAEGV
jgi:hypothetical protein